MIGEWTNKLAELIKEFFFLFKFWIVVNAFEEAVILRFGSYSRTLRSDDGWKITRKGKPTGFHFMIPFKIEEDFKDNVKPKMFDLANQSITLKDGTQITLDLSCLWSIYDIKTFTLDVENSDTALGGIMGIAQEYLFQFSWQDLIEMRSRAAENKRYNSLPQNLKTEFNRYTEEFGAQIEEVFINSFTKTSLNDGVVRILGYDSSGA